MSLATALALALFACALVGVSLAKRVPVAASFASPLRALFPSWRFFESADSSFSVLARVRVGAGDAGAFRPLPPAPRRTLFGLVFGPQQNLALACHDLVETLVNELAERGATETADAEQLTSFKLLQHMAEYFLRPESGAGAHYQLKLVSHAPDGESDELLLSPFYPLA